MANRVPQTTLLPPEIAYFLDKMLPKNRVLAESFLAELRSRGQQHSSLRIHARALEHLDRTLRKHFSTMSREDLIAWVNASQERLAPMTLQGYASSASRFFAHIGKPENLVRFSARGKRKRPIEILEPEEVLKMAQAALHPRDRALVMVLYDTGCRQQGLLGMKAGDVEFDELGARIRIRETKNNSERIVRAAKCTEALKAWLAVHPGPRDANSISPDAPLWTNLPQPQYRIDGDGLWALLRRLAKRAGIRKRVHPHGFRHTRATHLARHLTDGQMRAHLGWSRSSPMPAHYAHLSGRDTEEAILRESGVDFGKPKPDPLRLRTCSNCGHANGQTAVACQLCNRPLDEGAALAAYGLRSDGDAFVAEVLRRLIELVPGKVEEVLRQPEIRARLTDLEKRSAIATPD